MMYKVCHERRHGSKPDTPTTFTGFWKRNQNYKEDNSKNLNTKIEIIFKCGAIIMEIHNCRVIS